jgi:serine protease Do
MSVLDELQTAAAVVTASVAPATVRIGRDGGRGLGLVTAPGIVVTNAHNLRGHQVTVTFSDGRVAAGVVRAVDADGDVAVVAVDTAGAEPVTWSDVQPAIGMPVWTVTRTPTGASRVTSGTVSAIGRPFRGPGGRLIAASLEHTAPLARGSSGGALVDAAGHVVGVNTHRLGDGFYLALPTDTDLRARIERLAGGQSPVRRRLGVALAPAHAARRLRAAVGLPARDGLLVRGVEDGSPAANAGIRTGDLIVEVGGRGTASPDDLFAALEVSDVRLAVTVARGGDDVTVEADFTPSDAEPAGGPTPDPTAGPTDEG